MMTYASLYYKDSTIPLYLSLLHLQPPGADLDERGLPGHHPGLLGHHRGAPGLPRVRQEQTLLLLLVRVVRGEELRRDHLVPRDERGGARRPEGRGETRGLTSIICTNQ